MWLSATYDLAGKRIKMVRVEAIPYHKGIGVRFTDDPNGSDLTIELTKKTAAELVRTLKEAGITA